MAPTLRVTSEESRRRFIEIRSARSNPSRTRSTTWLERCTSTWVFGYRAMKAAGVRHIVYTSLPNPGSGSPVAFAPDHRETEAAIKASGLDFTLLRNNIYTDLLLQSLPPAIASGKLVTARGKGAAAYVTREDCAQAVLAEPSAGGRTLDVTGAAALSGEEIAALASELSGRKVVHVSVPLEALVQGLVQHGLPQPLAEAYASFDAGIQKGELSTVTHAVRHLTGGEPQSVREFLTAHRAKLSAS